jgi:hypothetical protein
MASRVGAAVDLGQGVKELIELVVVLDVEWMEVDTTERSRDLAVVGARIEVLDDKARLDELDARDEGLALNAVLV